jgi:hypothetical protein
MVVPEKTLSVASQHALQDMVELQMHLEAHSPYTHWLMLRRRIGGRPEAREPYSNSVESSVVTELLERLLIEAASSRTLVVSRFGHEFYEREIKAHTSA